MKTRDAFALHYFDEKRLFDFDNWYNLCRNLRRDNLDALPRITTEAVIGIKRFEKFHRRIVNHIMRLNRYQARMAEKIVEEGVSSAAQRKIRRAGILKKGYEGLAPRLSAMIDVIERCLQDTQNSARGIFLEGFSKRLREARKAAGLTQEELAVRLGIKRVTYTSYENKRNEPNVSLLVPLANQLGCTTNWLLGV